MNVRITICFLFALTLFSCKPNNKSVSKVKSNKVSITDSVITKNTGRIDKTTALRDSIWNAAGENKIKVDSSDLQEVNNKFKLRGAPINPKIIEEFIPWDSDNKPSIMSVDMAVSNAGTNRYYVGESPILDKFDFISVKETNCTDNSFVIFKYKWLGKLQNDIHVIEYINDGSFSGVFISLVFVKFKIDSYNSNGKKYKQLLMTNVASYGLGDRTENNIKLYKNKNRVLVISKAFDDSTNKKRRFVIQL
jgi:hypothetical protein